MTIATASVYGILYNTGFLPIDEAYVPPGEPAPFRAMRPYEDPFPSEAFWNTPIGSGITYTSTSDPRHTAIVGMVANLNYNNWTDPVYLSTGTDPLVTVEHRAFLPSGWNSLTNSQTCAPSGAGALSKKYTGIRIPTAAAWQSTSNTDRKVIVVQGSDVTLNVYGADGTTLLSSTFYPAGSMSVEIHKFQRTTTSTLIYSTNLSKQDIVNGYGLTEGAIASGITLTQGYVRTWEQTAAAAGDKFAIKHALKIGLANGNLKAGPLWPARTEDSDSSSYTGTVPYGTHVMLPASFNVETFTVGGSAIDDETKAYLYALKLFGAYVVIRAGSTGVMSFGAEPRSPMSSARATKIKAALTAAIPSLRVSSNSHSVGTLDSATRQPVNPALIAGGGTRITAGMSLADFDNATGLKLPIDPAGLWT